ncbi:hypothetical protein RJP21_14930 [Paenibacillus sp. VCA1]|uniref:hypothetical protein n=1 Tax=Paenibacillus sp. VCA1 TaxID=3039148 RepID=UPI0028714E1B|nr:hypothetical protein [Paenibacillus sp. VCA1]MDR9854907.1 hypothetical protein [Paenibacillus sp. VCA1]
MPGLYKVRYEFPKGIPNANEETEIMIVTTDRAGNPLSRFKVTHEKLIHLIIVNHDLSFFNHIHPEYEGNGVFKVKTVFPDGGKYKLFVDFVTEDDVASNLSEWVEVSGTLAGHHKLEPESKLVKEVDGREFELSLSTDRAQSDTILTYTVKDAHSKKEIVDLEQYLGAAGHVVVLSADTKHYLHVHPVDESSKGPTAAFATSFPEKGIYKIWGQFQHRGDVLTVPFVVEAK